MKKSQKSEVIESLKQKFDDATFFYFIDESTLTAAKTSKLRRTAFEKGISYSVVKNTLIKKALEQFKGNFRHTFSLWTYFNS